MDRALLQRLASWAFPEGAVFAAAAAVALLTPLREPVGRFTGFYAAAVLVLGLAVGLRFSRSRLLFTLLLLTLADRFLPHLPAGDAAAERAAFQTIAILLPVNLAAFTLLPERGVLTTGGFARLAAILGQAVAAAAFASGAPELTAGTLERAWLPPPPGSTAWALPLGDPALLAFALAAGALIAGLFFESGAGGRPALWALAAVFVGFNADPAGPLPTFFFATAGLMLVTGVVEASFSMAYRDGLTGLPARRALNEALERLDGPVTVAMVDVDHFKQVNDRHGHDVGDQVLKMVAGQLATVVGGGTAFRYGGEEFAILFPGKTVPDVLPELERLRTEIAQAGFAVRRLTRPRRKPRAAPATRSTRGLLSVTISIGVAQSVAAADRALYRAKAGGRNQVRQ